MLPTCLCSRGYVMQPVRCCCSRGMPSAGAAAVAVACPWRLLQRGCRQPVSHLPGSALLAWLHGEHAGVIMSTYLCVRVIPTGIAPAMCGCMLTEATQGYVTLFSDRVNTLQTAQ